MFSFVGKSGDSEPYVKNHIRSVNLAKPKQINILIFNDGICFGLVLLENNYCGTHTNIHTV